MAQFELEQTQSLETRQEFKLIARLEQANLLEMPEDEFHRLIIEVEKSPLFKRLYQRERIIRYQRFPKTDISSHFYELKEELLADEGSLDMGSLLRDKEDIVSQIRNLGLEKFKRYFLYPEPEMTIEEIAQECNLKISQVKKINSVIDEFSILSEFYHPSDLGSGDEIHYSKIASIERGLDGFVIGYFSPCHARGRYWIDYERFEGLKRDGFFNTAGVKEIRQLFRKLELINSCKDTVFRILQNIVEKQALYLESGDLNALLPFSQMGLAEKLGLVPSSISRAIKGKSVETPFGEEKPLKDFFPRPKMFKKRLVRQLIEAEKEPISDGAIKGKLEEKFGVSLSRRSVASLRKELKIPAAWRRKQTSAQ